MKFNVVLTYNDGKTYEYINIEDDDIKFFIKDLDFSGIRSIQITLPEEKAP